MLRRSLLAFALAACSRAPEARPIATVAAAPASVATPNESATAVVPRELGSPGRSDKAKRLLAEALLRVPALSVEVARLRGVEPISVRARVQEQADFRTYLISELDVELPVAKSREASRALVHLGLLAPKSDIRTLTEQALLSQAGAYYDPVSREFRVVLAIENKAALDAMLAHEIQHAYQDKDGELLSYLGGRGNSENLSEDVLNARRFVIEGEATLIMTAQMVGALSGQNPLTPATLPMIQTQIRMMAGFDADKLTALSSNMGDFVDLGPEMAQAMRESKNIPPYVLWPLTDAYMKGAATVLDAYVAGGWPAVDALRANPPESTEQVLHTSKLLGNRDHPVKLTLPEPPAPWTKLGGPDTLGELLFRVYFRLWAEGDPAELAADWDGDTWAAYANGDRTLSFLATAWDSPKRAQEFAAVYVKTLAKRGHVGDVACKNNLVLVVDGCDKSSCPELIALLAKKLEIEGKPGPK